VSFHVNGVFPCSVGGHRLRLPVPEALWRVGGHGDIGSGRQRSGAGCRSLDVRHMWRTGRRGGGLPQSPGTTQTTLRTRSWGSCAVAPAEGVARGGRQSDGVLRVASILNSPAPPFPLPGSALQWEPKGATIRPWAQQGSNRFRSLLPQISDHALAVAEGWHVKG